VTWLSLFFSVSMIAASLAQADLGHWREFPRVAPCAKNHRTTSLARTDNWNGVAASSAETGAIPHSASSSPGNYIRILYGGLLPEPVMVFVCIVEQQKEPAQDRMLLPISPVFHFSPPVK
jgi:hypothetical protein